VNNSGHNAWFDDVTAHATGGTDQARAFSNSGFGMILVDSTLRATANPVSCRALHNEGDEFSIRGVTASASPCAGVGVGVFSHGANGVLDDVRAVGDIGIEISVTGGTVSISDVNVDAAMYGVSNSAGLSVVEIGHGWIAGGTNSVYQTAGTVTLEGVILEGGPVSGTVTCTACMRNGTFNATGCP
jgi:hypothetical protein